MCLDSFLYPFFKVVLLATNFLVFLHLRMLSFPLHFWRIICLNVGFGVDNSFLLALEKCCATSSWAPWFQMSNLLAFKLMSIYGCGTVPRMAGGLAADTVASRSDSTLGLCWASLLLILWPQKAGFSWFFCLWLLGVQDCRTPLSPGARNTWEIKQKP